MYLFSSLFVGVTEGNILFHQSTKLKMNAGTIPGFIAGTISED